MLVFGQMLLHSLIHLFEWKKGDPGISLSDLTLSHSIPVIAAAVIVLTQRDAGGNANTPFITQEL